MADLNIALILRFVDQATRPARTALNALDKAGAALRDSGRAQMKLSQEQMAATVERSKALLGEAAALGATGYAMVKALQPAIDFEQKMAEVGKVVDFQSGDGIQKLGRDIQDLVTAGGLPIAADGIAEIVAAAAQANLIDAALPDAEKRLQLVAFGEAAAKMGVAFDVSAAEAGQAMATWRTQLNLTQSEAGLLGDAVNYLSNNMNASAAAVTDVIARSGALAKVAGLTTTEIAALSAAFVSAAPSPEIAATALKNFTGTLVSGQAMTDSQVEIMDRLGFSATDLAKRMGTDARGAIMDVMQALSQLPAYEQSAALSQLFGQESVGAIAPLLSNLGGLERSFELVGDQSRYAGAMQKEYEGVAATTASQLRVLQNYTTRVAVAIGMPLLGAIKDIVAIMGPLMGGLSGWIDANPELVRGIAAALVGMFALRVGLLGLRFALQPMIMSWWALRWAFGAITWAAGALVGVLPMLANAVAFVGRALLIAGRAALTNPLILVLTAIAGLAYVIYRNWDGIVAYFTAKIDRVRAAFDEGLLNGVLAALSEFNPWRMIYDGAQALFAYITGWDFSDVMAALLSAFSLDPATLIDKGAQMITNLWTGIRSVIGNMTAWLKEQILGALPDWLTRFVASGEIRATTTVPGAEGPAPGRALGGPVRAGQIYRWMEEGQEMFSPTADGSVVSTRELRTLRAGGGGNRSLSIGGITINAQPGQSPRDIAREVLAEVRRLAGDAGIPLHDGGQYAN